VPATRRRLPAGLIWRLRAKSKFVKPIKLIWVVQTSVQKYSAFAVGQISGIASHVPARKRGVAQRHQRGAGCGGRGGTI
jgi:hypothetical protein